MSNEGFASLMVGENKRFLDKRLKQGYTSISYGRGEWIETVRDSKQEKVSGAYIMRGKSDGQVAVHYQKQFSTDPEWRTMQGMSGEEEFSEKDFEEFKERWKIEERPARDLAQVVSELTPPRRKAQ